MSRAPNRKMGNALSRVALGVALFAISLMLLIGLVKGFSYYPAVKRFATDPNGFVHGKTLGPFVMLLFYMTVGVVFAVHRLTKRGADIIRLAAQEARGNRIQADALPAEEVLVRSAREPSAPSETLLRATGSEEETKAEELLRVASGATGEQDR